MWMRTGQYSTELLLLVPCQGGYGEGLRQRGTSQTGITSDKSVTLGMSRTVSQALSPAVGPLSVRQASRWVATMSHVTCVMYRCVVCEMVGSTIRSAPRSALKSRKAAGGITLYITICVSLVLPHAIMHIFLLTLILLLSEGQMHKSHNVNVMMMACIMSNLHWTMHGIVCNHNKRICLHTVTQPDHTLCRPVDRDLSAPASTTPIVVETQLARAGTIIRRNTDNVSRGGSSGLPISP